MDDSSDWALGDASMDLGLATVSSSGASSSDDNWLLPESESSWESTRGADVSSSSDNIPWDAAVDETPHARLPPFSSFEATDITVPLPVGPADGMPASAKRQRPQSIGLHRDHPQQHQQRPPAPSSSRGAGKGTASPQCPVRFERMTYWQALELIQAPTRCSGPRPAYLSQVYTNVAGMHGLVFKETMRTRRKQRTDQWLAQGGPNGSSCEAVASGVSLRRKYGQLTLRTPETAEPCEVLRFHEYTVQFESPQLDSTASSDIHDCKLFHILPPGANQKLRAHEQSPEKQADRAADNGQTISGLLTLQLATEAGAKVGPRHQPRWIEFNDSRGHQMGSIAASKSGDGVVLSSGSGDFAEWHPKLPGERPFEEGDVVGFCPPQTQETSNVDSTNSDHYYITLSTNGAKQLGIISRKAIVQGSEPKAVGQASSGRCWDTVAYCGRVPVKVIGSVRAGDILVPSGLGDGTAVAQTNRNGHVKLGVAEHNVRHVRGDSHEGLYEMLPLSDNKRASWQLVNCSVVAPSNTVSTLEQGWNRNFHRYLAGIMVVLMISVAVICYPIDSPCAPIELPAHGVLRGGCDGTVGSTCHVSCHDGFSAVEMGSVHGRLDDIEEVDAPISAQALNPIGGSLTVAPPQLDSGALLQFPACSSCFLTDGLACQPSNRSTAPPFPLPVVPPSWAGYSVMSSSQDPYNCASDILSLQTCEASAENGGGVLCFAPFDGYEPCEICRETGPSHVDAPSIDASASQSSVGAKGFGMSGYAAEGPGLACEATARGLPWNVRMIGTQYDPDEHTLCASTQNPLTAPWSLEWCRHLSTGKMKTILSDDVTRTARLCAPVDLQHQWQEHWQDVVNQTNIGQHLWMPHHQADPEEHSTRIDVTSTDMWKTTDGTEVHTLDVVPDTSSQVQGEVLQSPRAQSRHCKGHGDYTGSMIRCVRYTHCPAEKLGALRNRACRHCAGKEAVLLVPRTPMAMLSSAHEASPSIVVVHVPCPAGFHGHVNRTCGPDGWVEESVLDGECTRKRCLALGVRLQLANSLNTNTAIYNATVQLPTAVEGTGRVFASCPTGYAGNVSAACMPDADRWTSLQVHCSAVHET